MPRVSGSKDYISLANGLITESSPLNFPEGATADELNFVLNKDGLIRERRKGFSFQRPQNVVESLDVTIENAVYWKSPDLIILVTTDATPKTTLRIYRNDENFTQVLVQNINSSISSTQISENTNFVVITTSADQKPVVLEYEPQNSRVEIYDINLYVRDFELVDDNLGVAERPLPLSGLPTPPPLDMSDNHLYNLYNAGWYLDRRIQNEASQPFGDPIEAFREYSLSGPPFGVYPSNSDIVSIGVSINENGVTTFRADELNGTALGNTEAPRGHYIYDINDFDREARRLDRTIDGAPSNTLTSTGTVNL